ncbi:hypothetical protein KKC97_07485 [bacterium]|nr:hypothetical protein [bacterium]
MQVDPVYTYNTPNANQIASRADTTDQADFLAMLTAQLQNQDPLSPLEGHEYAAQLATFSQLQELEEMNSTLAASLDANLLLAQSINNNMATSLIGKTIRADINSVTVGSSGDVSLHYHLPESATEISIEINDANGDVVRTITVPPTAAGDIDTVWDGRNDDGLRVSEGDYSFSVSAVNAEGSSIAVENYIQGQVTAINYVNGQVTLSVNGVDVYLGQVISIMGDSSGEDSKKV